MMSRLARLVTAGVLATGLGAGALGVASAGTPAPSTSAGSPAPVAKDHHKGLLKRTLHGTFAVQRKGAVATVSIQRGEITAVSASSITLKSKDGYLGTYAVSKDTKLRASGAPAAASAFKTGMRATVFAVKSGSAFVAQRMVAGSPSTAGKSASPSASG